MPGSPSTCIIKPRASPSPAASLTIFLSAAPARTRCLGGAGNDTYVVDNAGDVVNESGGSGTDTVQASVSFSLADPVHAIGSIENLTLTGTDAINATGNNLDNVIVGNSGANILTGGLRCRHAERGWGQGYVRVSFPHRRR